MKSTLSLDSICFSLKTFRKNHNYYQKEIAHLLGISREYYSRLEQGKVYPSMQLFFKINNLIENKFCFPPNCKTTTENEMCNLCTSLEPNDKIIIKKIMERITV